MRATVVQWLGHMVQGERAPNTKRLCRARRDAGIRSRRVPAFGRKKSVMSWLSFLFECFVLNEKYTCRKGDPVLDIHDDFNYT